MSETEIWTSLGSGGLGVALTGFGFLLFKCLKKRCENSDSNSKCTTCCFSCDVHTSKLTRENTEKINELILEIKQLKNINP